MARWLAVGFVSGFFAVLVFHQGALAVLHGLQWTPGVGALSLPSLTDIHLLLRPEQ